MEIARIVTTEVKTTDGRILKEGSKIVFTDNNGVCCCGIYKGLGEKGTVLVDSLIHANDTRIIKPSSIKECYVASIDVIEKEI